MLKKLIGLGVVIGAATMVAGLAGGCSSTTNNVGGTDSGPATDSGKTGTTDGTVPDSGDQGGGDCPYTVATTDLPQGWKAPAAASDVCSASDIAAFKAALADQNGTDATLKASVMGACNACIFSKQTDANWTPLVDYDDGSGMGTTVLIINQGACYAGAPNGTPACGQAYFNVDNCIFGACPQGDTMHPCSDPSGCQMTSLMSGGTCADEETALGTGCGSSLMAIDAICSPTSAKTLGDAILAQVQVLCGGGSATDGGSTDASDDGG